MNLLTFVNGKNVLKGDMTDIPFGDNFFTYILSARLFTIFLQKNEDETLNEI